MNAEAIKFGPVFKESDMTIKKIKKEFIEKEQLFLKTFHSWILDLAATGKSDINKAFLNATFGLGTWLDWIKRKEKMEPGLFSIELHKEILIGIIVIHALQEKLKSHQDTNQTVDIYKTESDFKIAIYKYHTSIEDEIIKEYHKLEHYAATPMERLLLFIKHNFLRRKKTF